ncbi:MAG: C40 family peptidase [Ferruginibacter sp.]|nr:C40 family peptidase [Ferruginibacter sp.]
MKNLFFIALASSIFLGGATTANAQNSINSKKLADNAKPKISLKFIESIEITPDKISDNQPADVVENTDYPVAVTAAMVPANDGSSIEQCSAMQFRYAVMMNKEVETITNMPLYNLINDWWATRYRYGGTDKDGIDCSAFSGKVLSTIYGINLPRTAADQYDAAEKISIENLKEGDLVFFNTRGGVSHVGVYLSDNYFVHSSVSNGVTISSLTDDYYSRKFIGGGRISKL